MYLKSVLKLIPNWIGLFLSSRRYSYVSPLSSSQVLTALRPFYFVVHPDLFGKFPHERRVNENSLKLLNSYLESLLQAAQPHPTMVKFYIRDAGARASQNMHTIQVNLHSNDIHKTVHGILSACQLPTDYVDTLRKPNSNKIGNATSENTQNIFWNKSYQRRKVSDYEDKLKSVEEIDLSKWLKKNIGKAQIRVEACVPVRNEVQRLSNALINVFHLNDIIWDCGWGISHFRGCLQSFFKLAEQYPKEIAVLKDRTLVFGRKTGVSLDGHIILSSDHVRHLWLELLQSVPKFDNYLSQVPNAEKALSDVLLGMSINHRKFQPTVLVEKYIYLLGRLTAVLYRHRWQHGYPNTWPRRMNDYQLVVECEAGPLMLSPTGQFIAPASCPASILVSFITDNLALADDRMKQYSREKVEELAICKETIKAFGLVSLQKDDNVTPELMINCCKRLLNKNFQHLWYTILRGSHLRVSNFYSVLQDGEICIPWNWNSEIE